MPQKGLKRVKSLDKSEKNGYNRIVIVKATKEVAYLPGIHDKAYMISVSKCYFGRIIAYCGDSADGVMGKNIFDYLGMLDEDESALRDVISAYGKDGYATASYNGRWHAVFFFKDFAYDTGMCLVVVPAVSGRSVAEVMSEGVFEGFRVSERLLSLAKKKNGMARFEHSDSCLHLARVFGQIMEIKSLKLEYCAKPTEKIRNVSEEFAEIAKIELDFDTYLDSLDLELISTDEVFDGRLCAAVIIIFEMLASKCSRDSKLNVRVIRGMGAVRLELLFTKRSEGWQYPLEYLKNMAYANHAISIDEMKDPDAVGISFVPFYQDVGFVGVKDGEEIFNFVEQMELH